MSAVANPYAFPLPHFEQNGHVFYQEGMSLRDWFAGQALVALPHIGCGADLDHYDTARAAYQIANAMLRARAITSPVKGEGE